MATTPTEFVVRFPEFTSVSAPRIQMWLDFVDLLICSGMFGALGDWALYLLTAHYLQLDQNRQSAALSGVDSGSSIASLAVGDVNTSFDNTKVNSYMANMPKDAISQELATTEYGRMYLSLRRRFAPIATTTALLGR